MPAKKAAGAAATTKKTATASAHGSYKDMIKEAILNNPLLTKTGEQLKERNGSSRQAIKKYVKANNKVSVTSEAQFDSLFNKALRTGVEKGEFTQPKGTSGPVKLAKKESKPAEKKTTAAPAVKKETKPKAAAPKKAAPKKTTTAKKPATKKATATKAKTKANTAKPRAKATKTDAPAVTDVPAVLKKTKSGRVSKPQATTAKKLAAKKAAPKKAAAKAS